VYFAKLPRNSNGSPGVFVRAPWLFSANLPLRPSFAKEGPTGNNSRLCLAALRSGSCPTQVGRIGHSASMRSYPTIGIFGLAPSELASRRDRANDFLFTRKGFWATNERVAHLKEVQQSAGFSANADAQACANMLSLPNRTGEPKRLIDTWINSTQPLIDLDSRRKLFRRKRPPGTVLTGSGGFILQIFTQTPDSPLIVGGNPHEISDWFRNADRASSPRKPRSLGPCFRRLDSKKGFAPMWSARLRSVAPTFCRRWPSR
jgi:hypothetical protein